MSDRRVQIDTVIPSELSEVRRIQDDIEQSLQSNRFGDTDIFHIKLSVEEALVNAIKHGNKFTPGKSVRVSYTVDPKEFKIRIEDQGTGFNPDEVPDPRDDDHIDRPCGRGVFIIRNFMSHVAYTKNGTIVEMTKLRTPDES